ncbi:MAG: 2-C-methyl-D-erythritol 4-phosphate cytidylyltransferase [Lachnospiraceae bacterium]|nr:2-C-methyl-D-erythritol 4-phosphate cytidylyltransferase [Lachnospiraceae bacterium]
MYDDTNHMQSVKQKEKSFHGSGSHGKKCGKYAAIILCAGSGSRMKSDIPKQYMKLGDRMVMHYSVDTFEEDEDISEIVIVAAKSDVDMVKNEIIGRRCYNKVSNVVAGGTERFESVYNGMCALGSPDYVMIHDGARPFISHAVIDRLKDCVVENKACIPAVMSKDTVRIADDDGFVVMTPKRANVWNVQTPQTFEYESFKQAFDTYMSDVSAYPAVTDDAMIWELVTGKHVKIVQGDYDNIKITTPGDMEFARGLLESVKKEAR